MTTRKNAISFIREKPSYNAINERKDNVIGRRILEARKRTGLSLAKFSELLSAYGLTVGAAAINKWEFGGSVPSAYQLIAICYAAEIENGLQYFTANAPRPELNDSGLEKVAVYKADLIASGKYKPIPDTEHSIRYIEKPVSELPASAGTGEFLEDGNFEMVSFPESAVPKGADFGLRVSGDSMEPVYHDRQIVWVHQCDTLHPGEVGIFIYDGEGYIKMYDERMPEAAHIEAFTDSDGVLHKQRVLISYNKEYAPRLISANAGFKIVGRVI